MTTLGDSAQPRSHGGVEAAPAPRALREHLDELLGSPHFDGSVRSRQFLTYVVEESIAGRGEQLNQASIAMAVFGRKPDFDGLVDPIVRVQAGRLRRSLERYYLLSGDSVAYRVELPKGSYVPVFSRSGAERAPPAAPRKRVTPFSTGADWPCVMIQPFTVESPSHEFAARFQDELAQELCRYGDLQVICGGDRGELDWRADVRFELRGALRRCAGDDVICARLIDRNTGQQLWGDEFRTSSPGHFLGRMDDHARVVAARIGSEYGVVPRVLAAEQAAGRLDPAAPSSAIARCYHFFFSRQLSELGPALDALEQLTSRTPEIGVAWVHLARLYVANHAFELSARTTPMNRAIPCAAQGVLLDPENPRARCVLAIAMLLEGEVDAAADEVEQALRLNGDSLAYREIIGWLMALGGRWERGSSLMRECMERNPYHLPQVNHGLWADALRRGELGAAYRAALEYQDPAFFWRDLMLACSLGHLGRTSEARAKAADLLQSKPQFLQRGRALIGHFIKPVELRERVFEGLAKAGVILD